MISKLLGGGFTTNPSHPFDSLAIDFTELIPTEPNLLGTHRVRIINIDTKLLQTNKNGTVKRNKDGSLAIEWMNLLENSLWMCKRYNWIPHIVWGLNSPTPLVTLKGKPNGWLYGPNNWDVFNEYTTDMIKHVVETWGFKEIEIEVGNEPTGFGHATNEWWMPDISNPPPSDSLMWRASLEPYSNLYKNIANTVQTYRKKHPNVTIKVGGPAGNFGTFSPKAFPWIQTFVSNMLNEHIPLDFVSFHCYDKVHNQGQIFLDSIAALKARIAKAGSSAYISVSEWGYSVAGIDGITNLDPVAGAFALEFLYTLEKAKVDDDIFLSLNGAIEGKNSAALYYPHFPTLKDPKLWSQTYAMMALKELSALSKETRRNCTVVQSTDLHCFSAETSPGKIDIITWAYNWQTEVSHANWRPSSIPGIQNVVIKVHGLSGVVNSHQPIQYKIKVNGNLISSPLTISLSSSNHTLAVSGLNLRKGDFASISITMKPASTFAVASVTSINPTTDLSVNTVVNKTIENKAALLSPLPNSANNISNFSQRFKTFNTVKSNNINFSASEIKLYPNPTKDLLNINGLKASVRTTLSIVNAYGQVLQQLTTTGSSYTYNLKNFAAGIYILKIDADKKTTTLKFIKN
ncbi:MAG: T9SS type A sorting domain-containing protein [Chitinophagaceae bacterium]